MTWLVEKNFLNLHSPAFTFDEQFSKSIEVALQWCPHASSKINDDVSPRNIIFSIFQLHTAIAMNSRRIFDGNNTRITQAYNENFKMAGLILFSV